MTEIVEEDEDILNFTTCSDLCRLLKKTRIFSAFSRYIISQDPVPSLSYKKIAVFNLHLERYELMYREHDFNSVLFNVSRILVLS